MDLKAIFKSTAKAPLDNRQVVSSVADLTASDTFEGFAYDGMLVIVQATGDAYILKDAANVTTASSWVKLATDSSAAAAASEVESYEAQSSYIEIDETTAQDGHKIYTVDLKTLDIADATASSTGLADAWEVKSYVDDAIGDVEDIIEANEEVTAAALNDLNNKISSAATDAEIALDESTATGVAKRYTLSQGGKTVGTIDIPKDLVVDEGKVVDVVYEERSGESHYWDGETNIDSALTIDPEETPGYLAGKYIRLTIANSQALPLYIAAKDLVDIYTSGSAASDNVVISINAQNQITAEIGTGSTLAGVVSKVADIAEGAQVNVIETVKVNGTALTVTNKAVDVTVPTKLTDLTNDGNFVQDASYVHTDSNFTADEKTKLSGIEANADVNIIEGIKLNGSALTPDASKIVDLGNLATAAQLEDAEHVTAAALNDLNDRLEDAEDKLDGIASGAQVNVIETVKVNGTALVPDANKAVNITMPQNMAVTYMVEPTSEEYTDKTMTIPYSAHGCGNFPLVQVYAGMEVVNANVSVAVNSENHDVTVSWEIAASHESLPIHVRIVG